MIEENIVKSPLLKSIMIYGQSINRYDLNSDLRFITRGQLQRHGLWLINFFNVDNGMSDHELVFYKDGLLEGESVKDETVIEHLLSMMQWPKKY